MCCDHLEICDRISGPGFCKFVTGWRVWNYCAEGICTPIRIVLFWLTFKIPRRKLSGTLFHGVVSFLSFPFVRSYFVCYNSHRSHADIPYLEEVSRFIVRLKRTDRLRGPPSLLFSEYRGWFPRQVSRPLREAAPRTEVQNERRGTSTLYAFKACSVHFTCQRYAWF
jgi:hypothetical protein